MPTALKELRSFKNVKSQAFCSLTLKKNKFTEKANVLDSTHWGDTKSNQKLNEIEFYHNE